MKYAAIFYFLVLFAILGSYLIFAAPDNAQRLHIASASQLSATQHNAVLVQARDINTGSQFVGYSIETRWIRSDLTPVSESVRTKLPLNGEIVAPIPALPSTEVSGVEVMLLGSDDEIRKTAVVPASAFAETTVVKRLTPVEARDTFFSAVNPAAFMFNQANEVFIALFDHGEPWKGKLHIEQIHGTPANFLSDVSMHGLGHLKVAIASTVDLKLKADDKEFYVTFVPNEKPLHAVLDVPVMTPEHKPVLSVTPFGSPHDVTIDYFDNEAWIGRQVIPANRIRSAELELDYVYGDSPSLFYARVGMTSVGTPDSTQTFPIIASREEIADVQQAEFAVDMLKNWAMEHPESAWLKSALKDSRKTARAVRDYALGLIATHHAPQIVMRAKTESAEQAAFERSKSTQKSVMNVVLVAWFGLGLLVSLVLIIRNARKRRQMWDEILTSGNAEVGELPAQMSGFTFVILLILFIGFMISLYFMMQIV